MALEKISQLGQKLIDERLRMLAEFHLHQPSSKQSRVITRNLRRRRAMDSAALLLLVRGGDIRPQDYMALSLRKPVQTKDELLRAHGEFRYDAKNTNLPALRGVLKPTSFDLAGLVSYLLEHSSNVGEQWGNLEFRRLSPTLADNLKVMIASDFIAFQDHRGKQVAVFVQQEHGAKKVKGTPGTALVVHEHPLAEKVLKLAFQKRFVPPERG